jgi:hypothetical protein
MLNELKIKLSKKGLSKEEAQNVLMEICDYYNKHDNEEIAQDLVLRALEHRNSFGNFEIILDALVREVGLFPYLNYNNLQTKDLLAYEFHCPDNMDGIVFHRDQLSIYNKLIDGKNIALSAPASFGKSLIIDAVIASGKFNNIIIIVPTIALIDETRRRLSERFKETYKIITHPYQSREDKNIFVLTQERVIELEDIGDIDITAIDEFYKLNPINNDDDRAYTLNHALYNLNKRTKQLFMLGPGIDNVSESIRIKLNCEFIKTKYSTVACDIIKLDSHDNDMNALIELCHSLNDPTIIFCSSPNRASIVATYLLNNNIGILNKDMGAAVQWVADNYHPEWHFVKALEKGIGVHHGRIPRSLAQHVVRMFNEGKIKFLVCTSSLIEGVNTKAKNIIIFDNKIDKLKIDSFTFNNIKGRSGRMFEHYVGHVYIFHDPPDTELPEITSSAIEQTPDVPDRLLIQIDEGDLTEGSKQRLSKWTDNKVIRYETLKKNIGIDLQIQYNLAKEIRENANMYNAIMNWRQMPDYEQLSGICKIIWDYFNGRRIGAGSVRSPDQLAFLIRRLENKPSIREMIEERNEYVNNADVAVQYTLDFIRIWAMLQFPRILRAMNNIQSDIFENLGMPCGDFELYAHKVENLFLDPAIIALDEYGIPIQIAIKLEDFLKPDEDIDNALFNLKWLDINKLSLSEFETEIVLSTRDSI